MVSWAICDRALQFRGSRVLINHFASQYLTAQRRADCGTFRQNGKQEMIRFDKGNEDFCFARAQAEETGATVMGLCLLIKLLLGSCRCL